jgi:hypothetical protein
MHPLLHWLHDTTIGATVRDVPWMFPTFEALHFMGMSILVGVIAVIDLRVLGVAKGLPLGPLDRLVPLAVFGFAINVITGIGFFLSDPLAYARVTPFKVKMVLILLAGINVIWFWIKVSPQMKNWGAGVDASPLAKWLSFASLLFWLSVIVAGRFIAFSGTGTL